VRHRYEIDSYNYGPKDDPAAIDASDLLNDLALDIPQSIGAQINLNAPDASYLNSFTIKPDSEPNVKPLGEVKKSWIERNTLQIIQGRAFRQGDNSRWKSTVYIGQLGDKIKKELIPLDSNINGDDYRRFSTEMKLIVIFSLIEDALNLPSSQLPSGQRPQVVWGLVAATVDTVRDLVNRGVMRNLGEGKRPLESIEAADPDFEVGVEIVREISSIGTEKECS
jgi:hypothetical protein